MLNHPVLLIAAVLVALIFIAFSMIQDKAPHGEERDGKFHRVLKDNKH